MLGGLREGDDSRCPWPSDSYGGPVNVEHFKAQENRAEQPRLAENHPLQNGNQQEKIVVRLWSNNCALGSFQSLSVIPGAVKSLKYNAVVFWVGLIIQRSAVQIHPPQPT
jgi:hypothetical protein